MADISFNTTAGQTIEREMQMLFLNTGTNSTPTWSIIGKRVEDSSAEYDWGAETKTDILGQVYTSFKKPTITQSFDPCELDAGDAAQVKLWNLAVKDQDVSSLSAQDMLVVHKYATHSAGTPAAYFAERYSACAVEISSLGGSLNVQMPINVTFGGTRSTGKATINGSTVTFTAD